MGIVQEKVQKLVTAAERERNADFNLQENENGLLECRGSIVGLLPSVHS
jgi:hypothetical protein